MNQSLFVIACLALLPGRAAAPSSAAALTNINLAVVATPSSSYVSGDTRTSALNDGSSPRGSRGDRRGTYGNWPRQGTQWVQYDWSQPISTQCVEVYWWDDRQGVRLPKAARLKFWDGTEFVPVQNPNGLGVAGDRFNVTTFDEVTTSKLRIEMDGDGSFSTGILEWRVLDSGRSPDFPPRVTAGVDRVVILGGRTYLSGHVHSLKPTSRPTRLEWRKRSGPGQVTFEDSSQAETTARFDHPGRYILEFTASEGTMSASATLEVKVEPPPPAARLDVVYTKRYQIHSRLWNARAKALIVNWIPHCIDYIHRTNLTQGQGGIDNFVEAGKALRGEPHGRHQGYVFANAWVHQTVESICLALMVDPQGDPDILRAHDLMRATLEDWIPKILGAQEPDGYLQTAYTLADRARWPERWGARNRADHEGYVAGYFLESAINHYTLTEGSDRRLYDAAKKLADCWVTNLGPGKKEWYDGHQEMEQALVRFGRFVNDIEGGGRGDAYVALAKFLLDCRRNGSEYDQSHLPVQQQYEAVGHAVRAVYNYSGMADVAAETGDVDYQSAVMSLWDNLVNRKYYVTGGIGSGETSEGFGPDYSLRHNAYCESCSSCGLIFFQYKLNLAYHDAKYADLYEETMYNALLGATDLEGKTFYYTNPLVGGRRTPWHACPCCVGNIPRTLLMIPTWTYVKGRDALYVNLFIGSTITIERVAGTDVEMIQQTDYPWDGRVTLTVNPRQPATFSLHVRVPDRHTSVLYRSTPEVKGLKSFAVNGQPVTPKLERGYAVVTRAWKAGDTVAFELLLEAQRVKSDDRVLANRGLVALRYGPLVYNVEQADQPDLNGALSSQPLDTEWRDDLLQGVRVITGSWADGTPLVAVPHYARNNRLGGEGQPRSSSRVWIKDATTLQTDGGDHFLDGIGETALVARYLLDGNPTDRSRNGYHATLHGSGATYVEDPRFGKVLSLPGTGGAFVQIPGQALEGLDSLTVTGWLFLRSDRPGQRFFEFGPSPRASFFCTPRGAEEADGYRARITESGWTGEEGPTAPRVPLQRWVHLAVAFDVPRHTLSLYLDGVRVGQATNVSSNLESLLDPDDARRTQLYLGKSHDDTDPYLDAKLHDVRLYGLALADPQVATICRNARTSVEVAAPAGPIPAEPGAEPNAAASWWPVELVRVPDISVATVVGTLPRLPRLVPGEYRDGTKGPDVRVVWPSPTNNLPVLEPGTYVVTGRIAGTKLEPKATVTVTPAPHEPRGPQRTLEGFSLDRVTLDPDEQARPTPFMKHRDKFLHGLAQTDPDHFLYMFRDAFGQAQPGSARPLGGWDSQTTRLRGHASGHYLTAIAQAYASTGYDPALQANFRQRMNYLIETLHDLSQKSGRPAQEAGPFNADPTAVPPGPGRTNYDSNLSREGIRTDYWHWGRGFISAYPPDQFIMLEQGATYGGGNHQIWAPYYTLHKILAGLLDCYEVGGNRKALEIAQGMGFWVQQRLQAVPTATRIRMWNRYIAGEYGGMNEVLARLARLTGDQRFLDCARLFDNIHFFFGDDARTHGLARNVDTLRGKHANQHIPQITGALETYRNTGEAPYYQVADHFWHLCTECYQYSIGGVAGARNPNNAECFTAQPDSLFVNGFARGGQNETCATYNLLKLSRQLFMYDPSAHYMDYYERALYNDILASVAANDPGNTYHIPLNPGSRKQFGNANMDGFTCCNGTALESGTKLQDSIYFHSTNHQALYVNLFVPSTLVWRERDVVLTQRTSFPFEDTTRLSVRGGGKFDLRVRVPQWATRGFQVKLNGQPAAVAAKPGSYVMLGHSWNDGDTIELRMPFALHLDRVMDQPNIASLFYGPVLLAAEEPEPRSDWRPVALDVTDLGKSITGDPGTLRFAIGDAAFRPFFETYSRYSVYLDVRWE